MCLCSSSGPIRERNGTLRCTIASTFIHAYTPRVLGFASRLHIPNDNRKRPHRGPTQAFTNCKQCHSLEIPRGRVFLCWIARFRQGRRVSSPTLTCVAHSCRACSGRRMRGMYTSGARRPSVDLESFVRSPPRSSTQARTLPAKSQSPVPQARPQGLCSSLQPREPCLAFESHGPEDGSKIPRPCQ